MEINRPDRYRRIGHDPAAIEALFVELFLAAHKTPPARITLDLDATDDPIRVDLASAEDEAERTRRPARRFADFRWRTLDSWSRKRRVVTKAGWMPGRGERGANPRFVVTSLPAAEIGARALYERL